MKCAWISRHRSDYPLEMMCRVLGLSRSGYLNGQRRCISLRNTEVFKLLLSIKAAHSKVRGVYGAPKIQTKLAEQGIHAGIARIKRLRRLHGFTVFTNVSTKP